MSAFAVPVEITFRAVASGNPATVETATPVTVSAAVVHIGLKGERGERGEQGLRGFQGEKGDKGDTGDVTPAAEAALVAAQAARDASQGHAAVALGHADVAQSHADAADVKAAEAAALATEAGQARTLAEAARDAAFVNADVYQDVATGLAAVADGDQFQVVSADGLSIQRYRRDAGPVATPVGPSMPTKTGVDTVGIEAVTDDQEAAFSVVDEAGRRTWIETTKAGAPTVHAAAKIGATLTPENTPAMLAFEEADTDLNDLAIAMVDEAGRRTWIEATKAGRPTTRAANLMAVALEDSGVSPTPSTYKASHQAATPKIVSGPDIVCWGDSMTAGAGGGGTTYPSVLQGLLTAAGYPGTVRNSGVGGETSVTITARTGATTFIVDVSGGEIPAYGGVTVAFRQINGQSVAPLLQGTGGGGFIGSLAGVPGAITYSAGVYTFTRTAAGSAVSVTRPVPYYTDFSRERRGDVAIIWIGQNGPSNARAIEDARAIVQHMTALDKRFLVISKPTSTDADDAAWFAEFGRRFISIRKYMVEFGLADAGLPTTEGDATDIAAGVVPRSLRIDAVHWTADGYTILGNLVFDRLNELGWI